MFAPFFKYLVLPVALVGFMQAPLALAKGTEPQTAPAQLQDKLQEKVVYHINDSANAQALLRNVKNHLDASPKAKIAVVGHGKGIDFMLKDAADPSGNPYNVTMETLAARGTEFKVCYNTLKSRNLTEAVVAEPAKIVPSGVAEIGRLQSKEGYVYLKP